MNNIGMSLTASFCCVSYSSRRRITYKDWLRADIDVRQILIETHHLPTPGQSYSYKGVAMPRMSPNQFFDEFERNGFGTFTL
jgi:hypothetical protein